MKKDISKKAIWGLLVSSSIVISGFTQEKPAAMWHFDEESGATCGDAVNSAVAGKLHGNVTWGNVADGTAISRAAVVFNSTETEGQWVDFGNSKDVKEIGSLRDKQGLTVMCYFKSSRWKEMDAATPFVQKYEWGLHKGWMLGSRSDGRVGMWLMGGNTEGKGDNVIAAIPCSEISLNAWHHACGVIDQEQKEARFYLDGELKAVGFIRKGYIMPDPDYVAGQRLLVGHSGLQPGGQPWDYAAFAGAIDEVVIFTRALNAVEIAASIVDFRKGDASK